MCVCFPLLHFSSRCCRTFQLVPASQPANRRALCATKIYLHTGNKIYNENGKNWTLPTIYSTVHAAVHLLRNAGVFVYVCVRGINRKYKCSILHAGWAFRFVKAFWTPRSGLGWRRGGRAKAEEREMCFIGGTFPLRLNPVQRMFPVKGWIYAPVICFL